MKAYPAYKESGVDLAGDIPRHWNAAPLKFIANIVLGKMLTREDKGGYFKKSYLRAKNIGWEEVLADDINSMWFSAKELKQYRLKEDDLLVSEGGEVGRTAIWKNEIEECYIQNSVHKVSISEKYHPRYYLYHSEFFGKIGYYDSIVNRVSIAHLTKDKLKDVRFLVPPLPEQKAIADFLDRKTAQIDTLIEKKQRQIALLEEQRTALINQAVTKGLDPNVPLKDSGIEWLGEIPRHWEVSTVRYFFDVKLGKMLDSSKQAQYSMVKPYLRAANIHWDEILLDEVGVNEMGFTEEQLDRYRLEAGDLLVTEGGVTVGRSAIWNEEMPECYYQNSLNRARSLKSISTKWLYYWMYFVTNNGFIDILADKSTFGHLTNEKLKALPVLIPPKDEHFAIVEKLENFEPKVEAQIELLQKSIDLLQEYRTALISAAVTGKIDVREEEQGGAHL